jgi:hypothetical protein
MLEGSNDSSSNLDLRIYSPVLGSSFTWGRTFSGHSWRSAGSCKSSRVLFSTRFVLNFKLKWILWTRYLVHVMWSCVLKLCGHGTNLYRFNLLDIYIYNYSTEIELCTPTASSEYLLDRLRSYKSYWFICSIVGKLPQDTQALQVVDSGDTYSDSAHLESWPVYLPSFVRSGGH